MIKNKGMLNILKYNIALSQTLKRIQIPIGHGQMLDWLHSLLAKLLSNQPQGFPSVNVSALNQFNHCIPLYPKSIKEPTLSLKHSYFPFSSPVTTKPKSSRQYLYCKPTNVALCLLVSSGQNDHNQVHLFLLHEWTTNTIFSLCINLCTNDLS